MNKIYQLENGTQLVSEQLNGHLVKFMNVNNTPIYFYSDNPNDLKSKSEKVRAKAHDNLQRIRLVPTDRETMTRLFDSLDNKNDIIYTSNFYNYIALVINSANKKMLRYRSEKVPFDYLADIRQFFIVDIFEHTIEQDGERVKMDFNKFETMKELNYTLHKIATSELNKRLYKMYREVSLDSEVERILYNSDTATFINDLEKAFNQDNAEYTEYKQRIKRYTQIIEAVATETQLANYYKVIAKKEYEQSTTFEERQALTEEEKDAKYRLTSTERSNLRHLIAKVQDRL